MNTPAIHWPRLALELGVIFFGVTLAFFVENYREGLREAEELEEALSGLIHELNYLADRGVVHSTAIEESISAWHEADRTGVKAVPGSYRIPGSPFPPSGAWQSAVATGLDRKLPPELRLDIGYFYEEFIGIHSNYLRYAIITEQEVMPTALRGVENFYNVDGHIKAEYAVYMKLQLEFARDLARLLQHARQLAASLVEIQDEL